MTYPPVPPEAKAIAVPVIEISEDGEVTQHGPGGSSTAASAEVEQCQIPAVTVEAKFPGRPIIEISEEGNIIRRNVRPLATEVPTNGNRRRIMVVEDGLIIAEDTRRRLEALGYSVVAVVPSGERAIQVATEKRPDLVLMDIHLTGPMDGIQAADAIRRTLNIPVVFATAYSDDQTLQRAKAARPFGYIVKPVHPRERLARRRR
jgi:CheY-like chemotaxis protein